VESRPGATSQAVTVAELLNELEATRQLGTAAALARDRAFDALDDLRARLDRVAALCDMADWAHDLAPGDVPPSVRVDDLRRALTDDGRDAGEV
jgi:hypothetical protein